MATVKRLYVFATCVLSGIAALFSIISLSTEEWVVTDSAKWVQPELTSSSTIKYGLFQGFVSQQEPTFQTLQVTMTCLMNENVCALLCGKNKEERHNLLQQLYDNDPNATQDNSKCPSVHRSTTYVNKPISTFSTDDDTVKKFINAGVWISTIIFLIISLIFGLVASALSLWNTVSNPVQVYFSIFGLYIYNGAALCFLILAMALWGIMHVVVTFHNVAIYETLIGLMSSDKTASLGYSFWLNIIPLCFYIGSIVLLYVRQYQLSNDPGHKMVQREDNADPGIYLY